MAEAAFEFSIHPDRQDGVAVYAVAIGDHLGMDLVALTRLRAAVEASKLTGEDVLDEILLFVAGKRSGPNVQRLARAFEAVAPLIQPLKP
jgi:hypothetical protein